MEQTTNTKGQSRKKLLIILIAAVLTVALAVSAVLLLVTGPKATVAGFMDAYLETDAETMFELAMPDAMLQKEYPTDAALEKAIARMQARLEEIFSDMDADYDQWSVTCSMSDTEKITGAELDEIQALYAREYALKVASARKMTVTLTYCVDGEEHTVQAEAVVMRLGLRWYVDLAHSTLNKFF